MTDSQLVGINDALEAGSRRLDLLERRLSVLGASPVAALQSSTPPAAPTPAPYWVVDERDGTGSSGGYWPSWNKPPLDSDFDASSVVPNASLKFAIPSAKGELLWSHNTVGYTGAAAKLVRARLCLVNEGANATVNLNVTLSHDGIDASSATFLGVSVGGTTLDLDVGTADTWLKTIGANRQRHGLVAGSFVLPGGGAASIITVFVKTTASHYADRTYSVEFAVVGASVSFDNATAQGLLAA